MANGLAVLQDGAVLRLPVRAFDDTEFVAGEDAPDAGDFRLSTKDLERVHHGDGVGAISVWDASKTTAQEAFAILPPKPRLILELRVTDVLSLPFGLKVVSTPLNNTAVGSEGHCDIVDAWQNEPTAKQIRRALAAKAKAVGRILPATVP